MTKMATVTSRTTGKVFQIDTSLCSQFDFEHGQRVRVPGLKKEATVLGVAPLGEAEHALCVDAAKDILWILVHGEKGVSFVPNPKEDLEAID